MNDLKVETLCRITCSIYFYISPPIIELSSSIQKYKQKYWKTKSSKDNTFGGRKLDFIAQEMNRESNTILSKSTDMEISDQAIILKTEIEKVREQIQNIE